MDGVEASGGAVEVGNYGKRADGARHFRSLIGSEYAQIKLGNKC